MKLWKQGRQGLERLKRQLCWYAGGLTTQHFPATFVTLPLSTSISWQQRPPYCMDAMWKSALVWHQRRKQRSTGQVKAAPKAQVVTDMTSVSLSLALLSTLELIPAWHVCDWLCGLTDLLSADWLASQEKCFGSAERDHTKHHMLLPSCIETPAAL